MMINASYAMIAGYIYISSRPRDNRLRCPVGWHELDSLRRQHVSGLEMTTFENDSTGEVVIAFAGTQNARDWVANFGMGSGVGSDQLRQAVAYVLTVMAAFPGARISFTGDSLGGGLASLMGVFFNRPAVTFDQAHFAMGAGVSLSPDCSPNMRAASRHPPEIGHPGGWP